MSRKDLNWRSDDKLKKNIIIIFFMSVLIGIVAYSNSINIRNTNKLNNNILITAAHLEKVEGYNKLYEDKDRDVAYYIKDSIKLTRVVNQEVFIEGLEDCKIISSKEGSFQVTTSTPENIVNGMSGRRVLDKYNTPIGFVDAMSTGGVLECNTLE